MTAEDFEISTLFGGHRPPLQFNPALQKTFFRSLLSPGCSLTEFCLYRGSEKVAGVSLLSHVRWTPLILICTLRLRSGSGRPAQVQADAGLQQTVVYTDFLELHGYRKCAPVEDRVDLALDAAQHILGNADAGDRYLARVGGDGAPIRVRHCHAMDLQPEGSGVHLETLVQLVSDDRETDVPELSLRSLLNEARQVV